MYNIINNFDPFLHMTLADINWQFAVSDYWIGIKSIKYFMWSSNKLIQAIV